MKVNAATLLLLAMVLLFGFGWTTHGQEPTAPKKRPIAWEYRVAYRALSYDEKDFNDLGAPGGELVLAEHQMINGRSSAVRYIYKRPKP